MKYILGCGINGLIYGFYNKDFKIIGKSKRGMLDNTMLNATILFHDYPETRQLLDDLNIDYKPITWKIKYCKTIDDKEEFLSNISIEDKKALIKKKMGDDNFNVKDLTLSTNDFFIPVLEFDRHKLLTKLIENNTIIEDEVIRITEDEIITNTIRYKYDVLVSTINAKTFWNIYSAAMCELSGKQVTFAAVKNVKNFPNNTDLVYYIDEKNSFSRVNRCGNFYLVEWTGDISNKEIYKIFNKEDIIKIFKINDSIIETNYNNVPPRKIRFVGRFAEWNHSLKIQDAIRKAKQQYDFISIWNDQKDFNKNFIDLNKLDDIGYKQELTKTFVLCLYGEIDELLREINYKMHVPDKEIDREALKEEWVDVFKYWLCIGDTWNIDIEEFLNMYWHKSNKVKDKFARAKNEN